MAGRSSDEGTLEPPRAQLDVASLLDRFCGDAEMLEEVCQVFLQEYPRQLSAVRDAALRHDARALESSSHTLKGSLAIFGAGDAYEMACRLELLGRTTDFAQAERSYADLERHVVRLGKLLATLRVGPS